MNEAAALRFAAEQLAVCVDCGRVHVYRLIDTRSCECVDCTRDHGRYTWASPDDGHTYRPRYVNSDGRTVVHILRALAAELAEAKSA